MHLNVERIRIKSPFSINPKIIIIIWYLFTWKEKYRNHTYIDWYRSSLGVEFASIARYKMSHFICQPQDALCPYHKSHQVIVDYSVSYIIYKTIC